MKIPDDDYRHERQAAMRQIVENYPALTYRKGLNKFCWSIQVEAAKGRKDTALNALKFYTKTLSTTRNNDPPVLYLCGDAGTGKTHLGLGLAAYIMLNNWRTDSFGPDDQFNTFEYVDWPYYIQTLLDNDDLQQVNWDAHLMILDSMDKERPIPRSGDTFRITRLSTMLKHRLETLHRPTIIITRHSLQDLIGYMATNARGEVANAEAERVAEELVHIIARNIRVAGRTYGPNVGAEMAEDPTYIQRVLRSCLAKQSMTEFFPKESPFTGLPTLF
jgi:hypothetical protein